MNINSKPYFVRFPSLVCQWKQISACRMRKTHLCKCTVQSASAVHFRLGPTFSWGCET